jgi:hypothetical protein
MSSTGFGEVIKATLARENPREFEDIRKQNGVFAVNCYRD